MRNSEPLVTHSTFGLEYHGNDIGELGLSLGSHPSENRILHTGDESGEDFDQASSFDQLGLHQKTH